ncbi:hypothetical protein JCM12298_17640 [Desulfothermus naphthae]
MEGPTKNFLTKTKKNELIVSHITQIESLLRYKSSTKKLKSFLT